MNLGFVEGTVVASQKDPGLDGTKMLLVRHVGIDMKPGGAYTIAVDAVGAGPGELVMIVTGSSARMAQRVLNLPVDASIVAIIDAVSVEGKLIYDKAAKPAAAAPTPAPPPPPPPEQPAKQTARPPVVERKKAGVA
jgi:microcompartment protein CcmK/EutM